MPARLDDADADEETQIAPGDARAALAALRDRRADVAQGAPRFLCRGLKAVTAEMALSVTAFNLKRTMAILGTTELLRRLAPA